MKSFLIFFCAGSALLAFASLCRASLPAVPLRLVTGVGICGPELPGGRCTGFALQQENDWQGHQSTAESNDPDCTAIFCASAMLPASDTHFDMADSPSAKRAGGTNIPWSPSDRDGAYLLAGIPLIVGVGSLIGLDHRLPDDNRGIWKRSNQLDLEYGVALTEIGGSLWLGGQSRLGRTFWRSLDASAFSALAVQGLKYAFSRARPYQSESPNHWFQGSCCQSFPSGEVALQASFVTPFILEYHRNDPWVWALEVLPLYDAMARMKTQGHWQTDVLSSWALGTVFGIFAHNRHMPFFLSLMPHGVMVGWHTSF